MNSFIDRLQYYMQEKGINNNQMTVAAGLSVGLIGRAIKAKSGLNSESIEKILYAYPDLNPNWLLIGRGHMLIDSNDNNKNREVNGEVNRELSKKKCNLSPKSYDNPQDSTMTAEPSVQYGSTPSLSVYKRGEAEEIQPSRDTGYNELIKHLVEQIKEQSEEIGALKQENTSLKNQLAERAETAQDAERAHA